MSATVRHRRWSLPAASMPLGLLLALGCQTADAARQGLEPAGPTIPESAATSRSPSQRSPDPSSPDPSSPANAPKGAHSAALSDPGVKRSVKNDLIWKRYRAVKNDLMRGLSLTADELCRELGQFDCVDQVYLTALGGNEPFEKMLYRPSDSPTATTPVAIERVVWSACIARLSKDMAGGAKIFGALDLGSVSLDPNDEATQKAADSTTTKLYRALLARDPTPVELGVVRLLLNGDGGRDVSGRDFALSACFAIGSSAETLFF